MKSFTHYVGIDWTGANKKRHRALKIAICEIGTNAPSLVSPPSGYVNWSRIECAEWISGGCGLNNEARVLVGIDAAFGYPFYDEKGYLRGDLNIQSAPLMWSHVAKECEGSHDYFGGKFVERYSRHFRWQRYNREQRKFDTIVDKDFFKPELRRCENICISEKYGPCVSVFNLIGASQVGKSALSTMIMLNELQSSVNVCVWPFNEDRNQQVVLVEIYAALFSKLGGHLGKVRDRGTLNCVLRGLGSKPYRQELREDDKNVDDITDSLMTAAGLRHIASRQQYWRPPELSSMVRRTEGWIFGVT